MKRLPGEVWLRPRRNHGRCAFVAGLIYRTNDEMHALAGRLPWHQVADYRVFGDGNEAITNLLINKANRLGGLDPKERPP
jgi:hypothetical protein